jgi:hypothetical protein
VPRPLDRDRLAGALTALKSKQSQDFARRP